MIEWALIGLTAVLVFGVICLLRNVHSLLGRVDSLEIRVKDQSNEYDALNTRLWSLKHSLEALGTKLGYTQKMIYQHQSWEKEE